MVEAAAHIAMAGVDPTRFLMTGDAHERRTLLRVAARVVELQELRDENLATRIINRLGEVWR